MRTELILKRTLVASHSLDTNEAPHPHLFRFEFTFTGEPIRGRILDLPTLARALDVLLEPLQSRYLNDVPFLPEPARAFPTCETMGATFVDWIQSRVIPRFHAENPTLKLVSVLTALCETDGREWGAARVIP